MTNNASSVAPSSEALPPSRKEVDRNYEVDGIRGWASIIVLTYHFFCEMMGQAFPEFKNPLLTTLLSGGTAVTIFFILSGDALSSGFFQANNTRTIDKLLVKRYTRLTVPIFMSCTIVYILILLGLDFHAESKKLLHIEAWMKGVLTFTPDPLNLTRYALRDVYIHHTTESSYNPFLWTMSVEMLGSLLVFLYCYAWQSLKRPALTLFALGIIGLIAEVPFAPFALGVALAYARQRGMLHKISVWKYWPAASAAIILSTLIIDAALKNHHLTALLSGVLVICFYTNASLKSFFSSKFSIFLGHLSFLIYLLQFPILISFFSWSLLKHPELTSGPLTTEKFLLPIMAMALTIALAYPFRLAEKEILMRIDRYVSLLLTNFRP